MFSTLSVLVLALAFVSRSGPVESVWTAPRELGSFVLPHAGFVEVFAKDGGETSNPAEQLTLYISTFNFREFLDFSYLPKV